MELGLSLRGPRPPTAVSRPDTAASTVLQAGGLFVTEASSSPALRELRGEAGPSPALSPTLSVVPLPRLPTAASPAPASQFSKFWGGGGSPRREVGGSPRRAAAGTVWWERRDQRAESEIIARQRTFEQREGGSRGRGRGR
jgi:hypothetical protein